MTYKPDLEQARTMLKALAPHDGAFFTFATIKGKVTKHFHGTLEQHASQLTALNQQGAGVYVTVNQTDGKGRKAENITAIRALFVDFDTVNPKRLTDLLSLEFEHEGILTPSLIVESSTGKHHAYWIAEGIPLKQFGECQKQLIGFFDYIGDSPDQSITDTSRIMRMAGFYHNKGEPVLTKIIYPKGGQDIQRYSYEQIKAMIDSLPAPLEQTSQRQANTDTSKDSVADFDDFTKDQPLGIALAEIKHYLSFVADGDSYDKWLDVGMMLHHEFNGDIAGLELWDEWASQFNKYDGYDSIAEKWQTFDGMQKAKPITLRTLIKWAKENPNFKDYQISPNDIEQARAVIAELATLDTLEYALQSKAKAKLLNITLPMLDKAVKEAKAESDLDQMAKIIDDVEPYSEPVDGNRLAGEIYQLVKKYIVCDDAIAVTVTLWIFFTWAIDVCHIAPIAWINAPEKRCGKSTLLRFIKLLCKRALKVDNATPAAVFRCIEKYNPTLLVDEADTFMKRDENLRGIINAGYEKDGCVLRTVGDDHVPTPFNVFGAKVISGIGKLPTTIVDRSISLTLRRAMKHEKVERLRDLPKHETDVIKAKLSRWTSDNLSDIATAKPQLPESIYNRGFDTWEILFQIAATLGNDWLERITVACLTITGNEPAEPSLNEQLLTDIKAIFESRKTDRLATHDLLDSLTFDMGDGEAMRWANFYNGKAMTARQLASRLKEFKISNKPLRVNGEVKKGYDINDFKDAFNRYLS